jgi:hypothetical protein
MMDKAVVLEPQEVRDNVVRWLDELTEGA